MSTEVPPMEGSVVIDDPRRRMLVLAAMCAALVAVVSSVSSLNVAQQTIAVDLDASQSELLWVVNAYTLSLAALLLPVGALADRWGRKPVLAVGLALFAATGVLASMSESITALIATRTGMGIAAALVMPATLSVITSSFPTSARSAAVGVWSGFAGAGGVLGLLMSAFLLEHVSWQWLFIPAVVLACLALVLTMAVVPNSAESPEGRFDTVGSLLSVLAVGGIVLGIHEGPERGWFDPITAVGLVVGLVALAGFVVWELRQRLPLLDVRIFRNRQLTAGSIGLVVMFFALFGIMLVLIQYLTAVAEMSMLSAAAAMMPMATMIMSMSRLAPKLAHRFGNTTMIGVGVFVVAGGLGTMALMADGQSYRSILPGMLLLGLGLGLAMSPGTTAITTSLGPSQQGVASALNDTVREVASSLGIALLGSLLNSGYRSSVSAATGSLEPELAHRVEEGIAGAGQVAAQLGPDGADVFAAAQEAFVDGFTMSLWAAAVVVGLGGLVVVGLGSRSARSADVVPTNQPLATFAG